MRKTIRSLTLIMLALSLVLTSACTARSNRNPEAGATAAPGTEAQPMATGGPSAANTGQASILSDGSGGPQDGRLPLKYANGEDYVNADKLLETIGFKSVWESDHQLLKFGDNDAAYEIRMDSVEARREDDKLTLKKAPTVIDGAPHIPLSALADLLSDEISYAKEGSTLVLKPSPDQLQIGVDQDAPLPEGEALDFGDDADDPYKNVASDAEASVSWQGWEADEDGAVPAAALKDINIPALIAKARTYLGVKYDFGAAPYSQSGRFDCSSYTRYLFGIYGVSLPRTSRAQAKLGNTVSRSSLRVGDLMYFYVPGRFQTNKTVGHVGIYMGNRKMIHSSPLPKDGVQITNIDKAYWKRTFLYAKRLVQ